MRLARPMLLHRAAHDARKAALLARKQRRKAKERRLQRRQKKAAKLVRSREDNAKANLANIAGAKLPSSGALVGAFDEEAYCHVNGVDGDAWPHFLEQGFDEGCLLTIRTPVGLFVGILDYEMYLSRNEIEAISLDQPPYHPQQQAFADLKEKDMPSELPIKPAVATSVIGRFSTNLYYQANPDVSAYRRKPRGGAFDGAGYLKLHPDVHGHDPLEHYIKHVRVASLLHVWVWVELAMLIPILVLLTGLQRRSPNRCERSSRETQQALVQATQQDEEGEETPQEETKLPHESEGWPYERLETLRQIRTQ